MEYDDVVSAINDDEELQLGQLYFALPLSLLKYPLQPEEMAALAVKASSALMKSNTGGKKRGCRRKSVSPLLYSSESDSKSSMRKTSSAATGWCQSLSYPMVENNTDPTPLPENPTLAQIKIHNEERAKKYKAKTCIESSVFETIFIKIMDCENAKEAWDLLKEEYEGNNQTRLWSKDEQLDKKEQLREPF
ncbi:hypothetical protein GH714_012841 [Hevea brasiliensis]|uniref:Uncharacterized protein n=1 Tax=Hevea brasiliensis TaxID=3981 RepID=A0A6A6K5E8_HEVBR|nr:hypothetical protein GH714_012841 [Hevea brasiliensis]